MKSLRNINYTKQKLYAGIIDRKNIFRNSGKAFSAGEKGFTRKNYTIMLNFYSYNIFKIIKFIFSLQFYKMIKPQCFVLCNNLTGFRIPEVLIKSIKYIRTLSIRRNLNQ